MTVFADLSIVVILACVAAAFLAGYVDAIAGGGGLIQLPVLLYALPHTALATIFGTNKFSAIFGTAAAARKYSRNIAVDRKFAVVMMLAAGTGSALGASLTVLVDRHVLEPVVVVILLAVAIFTIVRPQLGQEDRVTRWTSSTFAVGLLGLSIGFYDGLIGPGTGTFLVFGIVLVLGHSFIRASGLAKFVNVMTNFAALCIFLPGGHIVPGLAALMAGANLAGGQLGARSAINKGSNFVRFVFVLVIVALVLKLAIL